MLGTRTIENPDQMHELGLELGKALRAGDVLVLTGPLGAGKTTLTRGIGEGLGVRGPVTSPTFVLARTHPSLVDGPPLVHVDAYRLNSAVELDDLDNSITIRRTKKPIDGKLELIANNVGRGNSREWQLQKLAITNSDATLNATGNWAREAAGTRRMASINRGSKCSKLPAISSKQKSSEMPSMPQGRALGSKAPTSSLPASYL